MEFEWDDEKATGNLTKHGVSFDEAKLSSMTHFTLISMTPTIPLMSTVILSLESLTRDGC
jgi:hypothetical protein